MIGKAEVSVDDKRRFSLPPKYRPGFTARNTDSGYTYATVVIPWFKGALAILPEPVWNDLARGLETLDYTKQEFDDAKMICLSMSEPLTTDPEGRLTLTPEQCEWVGIPAGGKGRLIVVGMGRILHAWNAEVWDSVKKTGTSQLALTDEQQFHDRALEGLLDWIRNAAPADVPEPDGSPEASAPDTTT
jgi:DNA-binding transcriptional regulator/RsmH inhibitor MraZ